MVRLSPERESCISVHQSLLLPWTLREVDSIFDQNFSLSFIGGRECNLDPCHHQVWGGEAIKSFRARVFHLGKVVRRFQKISGQGIVAISRRVGDGSEWGRGLQKICGWLFRKVLVAVLSSQPWGGEEDDEEKIEEWRRREGGSSGKSVVQSSGRCRRLLRLYRKLLWAVICKEGLDDVILIFFF